jgi:hypothetical protein
VTKKHLLIPLFLALILLFGVAGCSVLSGKQGDKQAEQEIPAEEIEAYTNELLSQGFEFCPGTKLDVTLTQIHENPQFNFFNEVSTYSSMEFQIVGEEQEQGLQTTAKLPLVGEGWAGVCQFTSQGSIQFDLQARLFPGEDGQPALLIYGECLSEVTSKPPCGDFGMIPLEKKVFFLIPYRNGGTYENEYRNQAVGISGSSTWTLHLPCE